MSGDLGLDARRASERRRIQEMDAVTLEARVERTIMSRVHPVIPNHWFAPASSQCRQLFIDGHYYGCIALCQAVAEGIAKFLCQKNSIRTKGSQRKRCDLLTKRRVLSPLAGRVLMNIHGTDRNAIHHLNEDIDRDAETLAKRAEGCVDSLYLIESAVFAFKMAAGGKIELQEAKYWLCEGEMTSVFLRL
jgi:hypothetical protein